ncbi:hypothetical protein C1882_01400 [Pseudomonas sp. FW305-E2]|nr:hypothetical protein C1882_01400 [Pseudomonas sp. FW305-E2]
MMRTLETMIMLGDPSMFEVADALRRYQGTQAAGSPAQEVERCRLLGRWRKVAIGSYRPIAASRDG